MGLLRGITTGGVCPPIRFEDTLFDFWTVYFTAWMFLRPSASIGLLGRRHKGVGPRGLAGWRTLQRFLWWCGKHLVLTRGLLQQMLKLQLGWFTCGVRWGLSGRLCWGAQAKCWWWQGRLGWQAVKTIDKTQWHDNLAIRWKMSDYKSRLVMVK